MLVCSDNMEDFHKAYHYQDNDFLSKEDSVLNVCNTIEQQTNESKTSDKYDRYKAHDIEPSFHIEIVCNKFLKIKSNHAVLYFAWRHLFWTKPFKHVVLPMHSLVNKILSNMKTIQDTLQDDYISAHVVRTILVSMSKGKRGCIRLCMITLPTPRKKRRKTQESLLAASKRDLLGDSVGVYFDPDVGKDIYDVLHHRVDPIGIKGSYISDIYPIHDTCLRYMLKREEDAPF